MSFSYKTSKSIIVDKNSFFIGTTGFDTTTTPSNESLIFSSDGSLGDAGLIPLPQKELEKVRANVLQ